MPAWTGDVCVEPAPALNKRWRQPGSNQTQTQKNIAVPGDSLHAEEPEGEEDEEIEDHIEHLAEEPEKGPTEEGPEEKADDGTTPAPAEVEVNPSLPVFQRPLMLSSSAFANVRRPLFDNLHL